MYMVHRTYSGFITDISLMSMKSSSFLSFKSLGVSISFTGYTFALDVCIWNPLKLKTELKSNESQWIKKNAYVDWALLCTCGDKKKHTQYPFFLMMR